MRILRVIILDSDVDTIRLFRLFEKENSALFTLLDVISDAYLIGDAINSSKPDLLVVGMDDGSFDPVILNNLSVHKPKLLFLSKDKLNAYQAYKYQGMDFLLKPVDFNELILSFYKVLKFIEMETIYQNDKIGKIKAINTLQKNNDYVAVASVDKIDLLKIEDIIFCKAEGKYTEFYVNKGVRVLSSRNLGEYVGLLDSNFFRIHHSYVVNIKYLIKIIKKDGLYCEFSNGHVLPVAKRRQEEFIRFIKL